MLPHFLIPGAGKSGTTSLVHLLGQHPEVFFPKRKEPAFFSTVVEKGSYHHGLTWYQDQFREAGPDQVLGEASTIYMYDPASPALIAENLVEPRFIFLLRHPVDRAYSNYWQDVKRGVRLPDFAKVIQEIDFGHFDDYKPDLFHPRQRGWAYLYASDYGQHIRRFLEVFPRESMLFLTLDDFRDNPEGVVSRAQAFLGVDPSFQPVDMSPKNPSTLPSLPGLERLLKNQILRSVAKRVLPWTKPVANWLRQMNQRRYAYPPVAPETRSLLNRFFRERISALEEQVDLDLTAWKSDR